MAGSQTNVYQMHMRLQGKAIKVTALAAPEYSQANFKESSYSSHIREHLPFSYFFSITFFPDIVIGIKIIAMQENEGMMIVPLVITTLALI